MTKLSTLVLLPILSGLLIGTSYIPLVPWALFFCLVPLFYYWLKVAKGPKQAFWGGWLTQFVLSLIGFHWIALTAVEFGHFPWWAGFLTLLAFAALAFLHYAVSGWITLWLQRRFAFSEGLFLFVAATSFALCDYYFPMIFPWHLGYPWLWAHWPGAQFADVIGFDGLNIVTIYINALLAWALVSWLERPQKKNRPIALFGGAIGLIAAVNLIGLGRAEPWKKTDNTARFLAVQGNIGNFEKAIVERGTAFRVPIIEKYVSLTSKGLVDFPDAQIIVWPETAFPDLLDRPFANSSNAVKARMVAKANDRTLLAGGYSQDAHGKDTYNALFEVDSTGELTEPPYRKTILLAFGETFPLSNVIPYMQFLPDMGSFGVGSGPTAMNLKMKAIGTGLEQTLKIGPQICYEGLYPWFSAALAKKGAQIFVNVTNDSWFGSDFEPYQHLFMTAARSIEFRRPLIRTTNTGITTAVLASGEFLQRSPLHQEWYGLFPIDYQSHPAHTIYEKIVGLWGYVLAFALAALVWFGRSERPTEKANGSTQVSHKVAK